MLKTDTLNVRVLKTFLETMCSSKVDDFCKKKLVLKFNTKKIIDQNFYKWKLKIREKYSFLSSREVHYQRSKSSYL